jgi:hypothetical protein
MSRWACLAALGVAAAGCGEEQLPAPKILAVEPSGMVASDSLTATLTLDMVLPFTVDYPGGRGAADAQVGILFGGLSLPSPRYDGQGVVSVFVPSMFQPSSYDVTVQLGDGRFATLPGGFTVQTGFWPLGYVFDPIGDQRSGVAFAVTVRAFGGGYYNTFKGTVSVTGTNASISPEQTGSFDKGVFTGVVVATLSGDTAKSVTLTARDAAGTSGTSSPFQLLP